MDEIGSGTGDSEGDQEGISLGWWAIEGIHLLALLRRAHAGEDPNQIYMEEYANGTREYYDGSEGGVEGDGTDPSHGV